jgi:hypothetical protein
MIFAVSHFGFWMSDFGLWVTAYDLSLPVYGATKSEPDWPVVAWVTNLVTWSKKSEPHWTAEGIVALYM